MDGYKYIFICKNSRYLTKGVPLVKCQIVSFLFVHENHQRWSNGCIYIYTYLYSYIVDI